MSKTRSYYPALDGLRGVGCFLIVAYHLFAYVHKYLFFSLLAMDIFFVLSGFLITDILLNTYGEKNYLKNFYIRRLLRVFPLYYSCLIFFFLILPRLVAMPLPIDYYLSNQAYFYFFLQNWLLILKPSNEVYVNHLWSMGVEEQFYLLWPLVFALIRKPKILLGILILLLVSFSFFRFYIWFHPIQNLSYYLFYSYTRIDGICIGCMVALTQRINAKFLLNYMGLIVLGMAIVNFIFYGINLHYNNTFPYLALIGYSTFSMIFGLLVHTIINNNSRFFIAVFDIAFLKFLGRISYGTYIFHWPLFLLINSFLIQWAENYFDPVSSQFLSSTVAIILSFFVGYLSYRYFELHFLKLKKYFA